MSRLPLLGEYLIIGGAVLVTDLMGRVTYTNMVAEEMIG